MKPDFRLSIRLDYFDPEVNVHRCIYMPGYDDTTLARHLEALLQHFRCEYQGCQIEAVRLVRMSLKGPPQDEIIKELQHE